MRKIYRKILICSILVVVILIINAAVGYINNILPNIITVRTNETTQYDFAIPVSLNTESRQKVALTGKNSIKAGKKGIYKGKYNLFGVIPIKNAKLKVVDKKTGYPVGLPIGLYLKTQGVMIIDAGHFENKKGEKVSPANEKVFSGEYIVKFNKISISNKAQLLYLINKNKNKSVILTIKSEMGIRTTIIKPEQAKNGQYMLGIWVRDDSQGIGTMSFVVDGKYYALGHGISDIDTGKLLSSHNGTIFNASIWGIKKGKKGEPGGLYGSVLYNKANVLGNIESNENSGIYGNIYTNLQQKYNISPLEIALSNQVKTGEAFIQIIENNHVKKYNIEILKINVNEKYKNMIIKITDKKLIEKTNGIVQGMSGCPIIQSGRIVGAVTHVMIDNPCCGYGILAENMIK